MRRPYAGLHNADYTTADVAEIYDAWHDERPSRAELDDRPEPVVPKQAIVPCGHCGDTCTHPLWCALQRSAERGRA